MYKHKQHGFTIVELLIVIVVIGILAAIVIVAYNGVQTRAKNTKTATAANSWIKAIKLYSAKEGKLPQAISCLGSPTTYPDNQQCFNDTAWKVNSGFLSLMAPYMSSTPEPDTTDIAGTLSGPVRGALYRWDSDTSGVVILMQSGTSSPCPKTSIGTATPATYGNGVVCQYTITN